VATRRDPFRSDDNCDQINRALATIGMINPRFPRRLFHLLDNEADMGRDVAKSGAGALDESVRIQTPADKQAGSDTMGDRIKAKLAAGKNGKTGFRRS